MTRKQVGEAWRQTKLERIKLEIEQQERKLSVLRCSHKLIANMSDRDATSLIRPEFFQEMKKRGFPEFRV